MAGPSIAVRVLADLKGLSDSFKTAQTTGEGAASKMHSAFSGMLGALNQSGVLGPFGAALAGIDDAIGQITAHGKEIGPALMGTGAALAGVGAGLSLLGSKDQAAHQQLQASIEATGNSYEDFGKQIEATIKKQENYGHTSAETQNALNKLTEATHDPAKALQLIGTASDVAAAKHISLEDAAGKVGKVYNGNTKLLKDFGVVVDKSTGLTASQKTATQALADVVSGQASAAQDTFAGKLDNIKTKVEDSIAQFGQKYGPALQIAGTVMAGLGGAIQAASAAQAVFNLVMAANPLILLGIALAAIVAILVVLAVKTGVLTDIWNGLKAVAGDVWSFILGAIRAVWNWIEANWPLLLGILLGPIALTAALIYKYWDQIKAGAADVWGFIVGGWNALIGFFTGIPGRLASIFSGMWHGIWDAFRATINMLIDGWNSLKFTLPKIDMGPIHIGGETIGVPSIPHLAQGGLITGDGLVFAHAGEVITPAPASAAGGPLVQINGSTFNSATDVEMIAKKLEFATRAGVRLS